MASDRERTATCACGALRIRVRGEPEIVSLCNCTACQRRTGSPFGVGAYFRKTEVAAIEGGSRTFTRTGEDTERSLTNHFCGACGTTVYWTLDLRPDHVGIAVGCFADPTFMRPMRATWTQHMHDWMVLPEGMPSFPKAAP